MAPRRRAAAAALGAALASFAHALPAGLYGVTGEGNLTVSSVSVVDGSVTPLASTNAGVAIAASLVTTPAVGGVVYALALSAVNRVNMTLLEVDLATANVTRSLPVPLPCQGVVGYSNEAVFSPQDGKVYIVGSPTTTDPTAPHVVGSIDVATGAWAHIIDLPGAKYWNFLGNFAAFSPTSRTMWFNLRNYTSGMVAVLVHVDTGAVTLRDGCATDNGAWDPATDSFITLGTYRNGTTIADVWRAQMSLPADGSGDCALGRVLYNEASPADGMDVDSVGVFDAASRTYFYYSGALSEALGLMALDWDTGAVTGPLVPPNGVPVPDSLVVVPAAAAAATVA
jgi:hypothetical protein